MNHNLDPIPSVNADASEVEAAMAVVAAARGMSVDTLARQLDVSRPKIKDHVDAFLGALNPNTRRTYATHLRRFVNGIGPICDSSCEACCTRPGLFTCHCECRKCMSSRVSIPPLGELLVSQEAYSLRHAQDLVTIAQRRAIKSGAWRNRKRAKRGRSIMRATGEGAESSAINAIQALYRSAAADHGIVNVAAVLEFPDSRPAPRRPLIAAELVELLYVTSRTGDDPELDTLLVDYGIATGARRSGAYGLNVGRIQVVNQIIELLDKNGNVQPAPVSAELVERLLAHARERGGAKCDPASPNYDPASAVFWTSAEDGGFQPLTSRHFDHLHERWQQLLPWANDERVTYHHLRHTMAVPMERYGAHVKRRYLRHSEGNVDDRYGACTLTELAEALGDYLGFQHPLAHGREDHRTAIVSRLGLAAPLVATGADDDSTEP
jgi:integrase